MNFESECPRCGTLNSVQLQTWDDSPAYPCFCGSCDYFFWIKRTADATETLTLQVGEFKPKPDIPPLPLKTPVFINNRDHEFFLEQGIIVKKDHKHYRIRFKSEDTRLNGKCLWFPADQVSEIPKEFRI